jgi:dipeptidyl aminopeptidase/acylaminoacyl peptidase
MTTLDQIKNNADLIDEIDWEMTPEEAVRLYLEWGNNWAGGNYVIRSKEDETVYFVVSTWKEPPVVYLIRRNSEEAKEIATIRMPDKIRNAFVKENGNLKGVYAVEGVVKEWLQKELAQA